MILLILLFALILRLLSIDQSLWLDEAINVNFINTLSLKDIIVKYTIGDFHPPLYHVLLKGWINLFGSSEISIRLPSVIFSIASVFLVYLIVKKLYDSKTALIASTLIATAPLHIYYSQEARMYMLAELLTLASVYFFISILNKETILKWFFFIFFTTALLYTDYLPYLIIPTYIIYLFLFRKRISIHTIRSFIPAFFLIFILLIPWLLIFPKQLGTGLSAAAASPAWSAVVGGSTFKDLLLTFVKFTIGRISVDSNLLYAMLFSPVALFTVLLFCLSFFRMSPKRTFLFFWLFIPILFAFIISFFIPVFAYFRLLFVLPAFYILWASGINTISWTLPTRVLLLLALLINVISTSIYLINPSFHREDWRSATKYVSTNASPTSLVLFESDSVPQPFIYYGKNKVNAKGGLDSWNPQRQKVKEIVYSSTENIDKIFMFQYLSDITDKEGLLFETITQSGYVNTSTKDFNGVGFVYEFIR